MRSRDELRQALTSAIASLNGQASLSLGPLVEYDRRHGGDLVHTLRVYLQLGCNANRAAQNLFLHRSGLLYRLGRIESLLGIRLDTFEDRVALELSVLALDGEAEAARGVS